MGKHICPVCGFELRKPAYVDGQGSLNICPCCKFQYGWDDDARHETFESWRKKWVAAGAVLRVYGEDRPADWDPARQLRNIGINIEDIRVAIEQSKTTEP